VLSIFILSRKMIAGFSCLFCGTGSRPNVTSAVERPHVEKSNNKELIQSTLYDQQTPYAAWRLYFPDQCMFDVIFVLIHCD